jgi:hypothetical protein
MTEAAFEQPAKLPVWSTVVQSYVLTFKNLGWFVKMAWVWVVVFAGIVALIYWVHWPYQQMENVPGQSSWWHLILTIVISLFVASSIAVAWHRRMLLGDNVASAFYFRLDRTVINYFAWGAFFTFFWLAPVVLTLTTIDQWAAQEAATTATEGSSNNVPEEGSDEDLGSSGASVGAWLLEGGIWSAMLSVGFAVSAVFLYVPTRLSLVLPALALEQKEFSVHDSWRLSSGNFWRLYFGTTLALALPLLALVVSIELLGFSEFSKTRAWYVFDGCLTEVMTLVIGMTGITFLSLAYRHFVGMPAQPSA